MTLDSPLDSKEIKPVNPKGNQPWIFIRRTSAEAEAPILWPLMWRTDFLEKTLILGKIKSREGGSRGWDGWMISLTHGHEFEQTQVNSEGQGSLLCCSSCGCKESDTTSWLNNNNLQMTFFSVFWLWDCGYKHLNQYRAFRLPWWLRWWRICLQCGRPGFNPWVRKIPWRRNWQSTPVFLPRESYGQRSLVGYSPWGHKESDTAEQLTHRHREL